MLDIRRLQILKTLEVEGTMTAVAAKLHMTTSAVVSLSIFWIASSSVAMATARSAVCASRNSLRSEACAS